jgi:hypothetical protein
MILRLALKVVMAIVLLPIMVIMAVFGLVFGGVALVAAVLLPLLPFLFLAACAYGLWRLLAGRPVRSFQL